MKRFPIDCPTNCPHFHCLTSESGGGISFICNLKNAQMHSSMIHYKELQLIEILLDQAKFTLDNSDFIFKANDKILSFKQNHYDKFLPICPLEDLLEERKEIK